MSAEREAVNDAIQQWFGDELVVQWCLVAEIESPERGRFIAHRAGGGHDGEAVPMAWTALGMLDAGAAVAREQVLNYTAHADDDDDERTET